MPEVATYAPGVPMWVDLASPDLEASKKFYTKLFGWDAYTTPDAAAGGYTLFRLNGKDVAGVGPLQNPQQPPAWSVYIATDNADATAKLVKEAGGQVVVAPFDVPKAGRMAVFQDPTGAFFSVWQAGEHKGAGIVNEPNSWTWNELNTKDIAKAKPFYQRIFGWGAKTNPGDQPYTEWQVKGRSIAGGMEALQPNVPPHWNTYFAVRNTDAAMKKATELGGKVLMGPMDTPQGPFAALRDPHGAMFAVIAMKG